MFDLKGTQSQTTYTWDFGDEYVVKMTGFKSSEIMMHSYNMSGMYTVSMNASNAKGMTSASVKVWIQGNLLFHYSEFGHYETIAIRLIKYTKWQQRNHVKYQTPLNGKEKNILCK